MQTIKLYLYNQKYSSKQKFKIIKSLIQSLGLVLLLLEILAFTLLAIIWKSMQLEQFIELLTEQWQYSLKSWVMVSFISRHTPKLIFLSHVYYTWDKSHSPSIYVLYRWIMASVAILSFDFSYNQFHTKINGASHRPHRLYCISIRFTCKCKRLI